MSSTPSSTAPKQDAPIAPNEPTTSTSPIKQEAAPGTASSHESATSTSSTKQDCSSNTVATEPTKAATTSTFYDPVGSTLDTSPMYHTPGMFPPHNWEQRKHEEQLPHLPKIHPPATRVSERAEEKAKALREGLPYDEEAAAAEERAEREKPGYGLLPRQSTYKHQDIKRVQMERYLARGKGPDYNPIGPSVSKDSEK